MTEFKSNYIFHDTSYLKSEKKKYTIFTNILLILILAMSLIWFVYGILHGIYIMSAMNTGVMIAMFLAAFFNRKGYYVTSLNLISFIVLAWIILSVIFFQGTNNTPVIGAHHWLLVYACLMPFFSIGIKNNFIWIHSGIGLLILIVMEFNLIQINPLIIDEKAVKFNNLFTPIAIAASLVLISRIFVNKIIHAENKYFKTNKQLELLLKNILPKEIAQRVLKEKKTFAEAFSECSVLFAKLTGLENSLEKGNTSDAMLTLHEIFSKFDEIVDKFSLERVKTIGNSYMVVSGAPEIREDHATVLAKFALELKESVKNYDGVNIRIGINSGPVVAGLIGKTTLIYDLWGDTVNVASRMESTGIIGEIQISEETRQLISSRYSLEERGDVSVKGKGKLTTYLIKKHKKITKVNI